MSEISLFKPIKVCLAFIHSSDEIILPAANILFRLLIAFDVIDGNLSTLLKDVVMLGNCDTVAEVVLSATENVFVVVSLKGVAVVVVSLKGVAVVGVPHFLNSV